MKLRDSKMEQVESKMKQIECSLVFADESNKNLGQIDLSTALNTFMSFPWPEELLKANKTGCCPSISFGAIPPGKGSEYLNIFVLEPGLYSVMFEAFAPGKIFGLIPKLKSVCLDKDEVKASFVADSIKKLYTLPQESLYEWIRRTT